MTSIDATSTTDTRPLWSTWGGGGIVLGGSLLFVATVVEWMLFQSDDPALIPVFGLLFLASAGVLALAMVPLAFGRHGDDGAVGRSLVGKIALVVFGLAFLANQITYFTVTYAVPAQSDDPAVGLLQTVLGLLQFIALLVGAIVIFRTGIATGAARWSLVALAIVSVVIAALAQASDDFAAVTVLYLLSTVAQIITGATYLTHRRPRAAV